jgi:hypothetical protein
MMSDKRMFFGVEVERSCITKLPSCFRYDNRRWDYAIKSDREIVNKLQTAGIFRSAYLKESGVWILKEIRH